MNQATNPLSEIKQFSLEVLNCFDELAQPELTSVTKKIWGFLYRRVQGIIIRKPDEELQQKLLKIYVILGKKFKDTEISLEINASEKLGSVPIPKIGELARQAKLTKVNEREALKLLEDLNL